MIMSSDGTWTVRCFDLITAPLPMQNWNGRNRPEADTRPTNISALFFTPINSNIVDGSSRIQSHNLARHGMLDSTEKHKIQDN
jgi:hypothetical protein